MRTWGYIHSKTLPFTSRIRGWKLHPLGTLIISVYLHYRKSGQHATITPVWRSATFAILISGKKKEYLIWRWGRDLHYPEVTDLGRHWASLKNFSNSGLLVQNRVLEMKQPSAKKIFKKSKMQEIMAQASHRFAWIFCNQSQMWGKKNWNHNYHICACKKKIAKVVKKSQNSTCSKTLKNLSWMPKQWEFTAQKWSASSSGSILAPILNFCEPNCRSRNFSNDLTQ